LHTATVPPLHTKVSEKGGCFCLFALVKTATAAKLCQSWCMNFEFYELFKLWQSLNLLSAVAGVSIGNLRVLMKPGRSFFIQIPTADSLD